MKRLGVAAMVLSGAAFLAPAPATADWHLGVGFRYEPAPRGAGPAFRHGYDRGWREGSDEGYRDAHRHRDAAFWREGEFRDGDGGYRRWMGPRWDYVAGFRRGYAEGYRRAYAAARPGWRDGRGDDDRYPYDDRGRRRYFDGDDRH
jgi:hypothetical protein